MDVTFRRFEGASHGFTHLGEWGADEAWQMMIDFLKEHMARPEMSR